MGAQGSFDTVGGPGARVPPKNKFERVLFEIGRPLGAVAGVTEEVVRREKGYSPQPYLNALSSGWKEAKTFDTFVDNPWLAFALNVGADPVTWMPLSWITKPVKAASVVIGADKVANAARSIKLIDRMDSKFRLYFGGPNAEIRKRNPQEIIDILDKRNIDFDDFMATFVDDMHEMLVKSTKSDEEAFDLTRLLLQRAPGKTFEDSLRNWSPELIAQYEALSPGAKTSYRTAWEQVRTMNSIRASRQMRNMDSYEALKDRITVAYKTLVENPHEILANELKLDEVLKGMDETQIKDVVNKLTPAQAVDEIIGILPDIDPQFKGLAGMAAKSGSLKDFRTDIHRLVHASAYEELAKLIERDGKLGQFRNFHKMFEQFYGAEATQVAAEYIARHPKSKEAKLFRSITGIKSSKKPPTTAQVQTIMDRMVPATKYRGIDDFYRQMRAATDIGDDQLIDVLKSMGKAMPEDLKATMSIDEIIRARAELKGMKTPESIDELKKAWDQQNPNRYKGRPLNAIRTGDVEKIAKVHLDEIEINMAELLKADGVAMARAISDDNMHRRLFSWLKDNDLIISAEDFKDLRKRTDFYRNLKKKMGPDDFAKREREGFAEVQNHPIFSGFAIPKSLADEINSFTSIAKNPKKIEEFVAMFARYQNIWKAFTLAYFPSYHGRNAVSNMWNMFLAGFGENPTDAQFLTRAHELQIKMRQARKAGKFGGGVSPEDADLIRDLRRGVVGAGQTAGELGRYLDRSNPFRHGFKSETVSNFFKPGWSAGRYGEDISRIALYLKMRDGKGMDHLNALRQVNKYLFDYRRGLTKFEDQWLRNGIMPFWAWTRFNMPLQLEMLWMKTGKFAALGKLKEAAQQQWGGPTPDETFQADWFKRAFNVRVRYNPSSGTYEYFFLDSWLPAADINKILDPAAGRDAFVSLLTPAKVPFEIAFNYSTFRKKKIEAYPGQKLPVSLPGGKTMDIPAKMDFLRRQLRPINEVDRFLDQTIDLSPTARWARIFIGKSYPYNPQEQLQWWLYKLNTDIRVLKGEQARALEKGRENEALRIQQMIDELQELQDYYE